MDLCLLFIHPPAHGSEVSPAARNTLDSARIPRASKLLICGLFQKGRVLAQDDEEALTALEQLHGELEERNQSAVCAIQRHGLNLVSHRLAYIVAWTLQGSSVKAWC